MGKQSKRLSLTGINAGGLTQADPALSQPGRITNALNIDFSPTLRGITSRYNTKLLSKSYEDATGELPIVDPMNSPIRTSDGKLWILYLNRAYQRVEIQELPTDGDESPVAATRVLLEFDASAETYLGSTPAEHLKILVIRDSVFIVNPTINVTSSLSPGQTDIGTESRGLIVIPSPKETGGATLMANVRVIATVPAAEGWGANAHDGGDVISSFTIDTENIPVGSSTEWLADSGNFRRFYGSNVVVHIGGNTVSLMAGASLVTYGGDVYRCISTHAKPSSPIPGSGSPADEFWEVVSTLGDGSTSQIPAFDNVSSGLYYTDEDAQDIYRFEVSISKANSDFDFKTYSSKPYSANRYVVTGANTPMDLPSYLPSTLWAENMVFEVANGYYFMFNTSDNTWVESVAPGEGRYINYESMPHEILYNSGWLVNIDDGGSFSLVPYDPLETESQIGVFGVAEWSSHPRDTGNIVSNPLPLFINSGITDMIIWRGRLVISSGNSCSMSKAGDYFKWVADTGREVLPSDPISVNQSGSTYWEISHLVPHQSDNLLLIGDGYISMIHSFGGALTPNTVGALQLGSSFGIYETIKPWVIADKLYYLRDSPEGGSNYLVLESLSLSTLLSTGGATEGIISGVHTQDLSPETPRLIPKVSTLRATYSVSTKEFMFLYSDSGEEETAYVVLRAKMQSLADNSQEVWWHRDSIPEVDDHLTHPFLISGGSSTMFVFTKGKVLLMDSSRSCKLALDNYYYVGTTEDPVSDLSALKASLPEGFKVYSPTTLGEAFDDEETIGLIVGRGITYHMEIPPQIPRDYNTGLPITKAYNGVIRGLEIEYTSTPEVPTPALGLTLSGMGLPTREIDIYNTPHGASGTKGSNYSHRVPCMSPMPRQVITIGSPHNSNSPPRSDLGITNVILDLRIITK